MRCLLCVKRPQLELNRRAIQQAVQHITAAHDCSALNVYNHAAGGCGASHGHVTIDSGTGLGQQQTGTCTHSGDAFTKRRARGREGAAKDAALRSDPHNHSPCTTAVFCCVGRQRTRHICSLYALGARPGFAATAPHRARASKQHDAQRGLLLRRRQVPCFWTRARPRQSQVAVAGAACQQCEPGGGPAQAGDRRGALPHRRRGRHRLRDRRAVLRRAARALRLPGAGVFALALLAAAAGRCREEKAARPTGSRCGSWPPADAAPGPPQVTVCESHTIPGGAAHTWAPLCCRRMLCPSNSLRAFTCRQLRHRTAPAPPTSHPAAATSATATTLRAAPRSTLG